MAVNKKFKCSNCGKEYFKWQGVCNNCNEYGTIKERTDIPAPSVAGKAKSQRGQEAITNNKPRTATEISRSKQPERLSSGIGEVDRVLGGGFVQGGVILLAGAPGTGKSTLTTQIAGKMSQAGETVLIASGEETQEQIAERAVRVHSDSDKVYIVSEGNLTNILEHIETLQPSLIVVDSLQTIVSDNSESKVGSISQVTEVATALTRSAKRLGIPMILIGQVTKDDSIAGPRVVEHLVDVEMFFEGSKDSPLKLLRGIKNRFGATDEIGCFEHEEDGLIEVTDPSGFFLSDHLEEAYGYANSVIVEGRRALPTEIQALVRPSALPNPRRISHGLDNSRAIMIQAIMEKYAHLRLDNKDIYMSTTGGIRIQDTSVDLALAAAILSSYFEVKIPDGTVFIGEVTLTGEIKLAREHKKRVKEAERLGFDHIYALREGTTNIHTVRELAEHLRRDSNL